MENKQALFSDCDEVILEGTIVGGGRQHFDYTDKTTGQPKSFDVCVVYVQSAWGMCTCRPSSRKSDISNLKIGQSVKWVVDGYSKERGQKVFIVRI